jgi:N-formylglutamate deformylase
MSDARHPLPTTALPVFTLHRGTAPLLISLPHVGTHLPPNIAASLVDRALAVEHTDWHLHQLYDFAKAMGASILVPTHSRFVIDLNRPPENTPMYPGVNNTELCPTRFFTGDPLYRDGQQPSDAAVAHRLQTYWRPYHDTLAAELARMKAQHGHALLWDGHSIENPQPWLFEGHLPDLNLGTADGTSCAPSLRAALMQTLGQQTDYTHVMDGRFKGGYITRQYGSPADGVHAVQMEKCYGTYMNDHAPWQLNEQRVARLQPLLRRLLQTMLDWHPTP